jgi:hypothetical protein
MPPPPAGRLTAVTIVFSRDSNDPRSDPSAAIPQFCYEPSSDPKRYPRFAWSAIATGSGERSSFK